MRRTGEEKWGSSFFDFRHHHQYSLFSSHEPHQPQKATLVEHFTVSDQRLVFSLTVYDTPERNGPTGTQQQWREGLKKHSRERQGPTPFAVGTNRQLLWLVRLLCQDPGPSISFRRRILMARYFAERQSKKAQGDREHGARGQACVSLRPTLAGK